MSKKIITIVFITIFSIMLWVFISLSGDYFYTVKFPIRFTDIPKGYSIAEYSNKEISVSLKGQGWQLAQLTFGRDPEFIIPVSDRPGKHKISLKNVIDENTWLTTAVEINDYSPTTLEYDLEKIESKKVIILSDADLNFKENYGLVSDIEIIPDTLTISGPKSVIDRIKNVYTVKKEFDSINEPVSESLNLKPIDGVKFSRNKVTIQFDVQKIVDKEFTDIPIKVRSIPPSKDLTLFPNKIDVILRGGINILGKLSSKDVKAYVKFQQALKDTLGYIVPNIEAPEFTTVIDTKPQRLEYIIKQY